MTRVLRLLPIGCLALLQVLPASSLLADPQRSPESKLGRATDTTVEAPVPVGTSAEESTERVEPSQLPASSLIWVAGVPVVILGNGLPIPLERSPLSFPRISALAGELGETGEDETSPDDP